LDLSRTSERRVKTVSGLLFEI